MSLRPFFSFYGGKWRDALKHYPCPVFDTIREPFAGSAGYSLRFPDRRVELSDVDPVIVGVWDYLIKASEIDLRALPDVPIDGTVDELEVCQEARWLIGFWLNKGASSPRKSPSSWMRSGVRPGSFWGPRVRETIASQVRHIRHWTVRECGYEVLDGATCTWFVDPPYEAAGAHYVHGSRGIDYGKLGLWCRSRIGQVIVCENATASWLPFRGIGSRKTTRTNRRSDEAVWIGGVLT